MKYTHIYIWKNHSKFYFTLSLPGFETRHPFYLDFYNGEERCKMERDSKSKREIYINVHIIKILKYF